MIRIDSQSSTPLYEQIIEQVKEMIVKGILKENEKLFSVRELASEIVLNPNTVSKAYKELERQGVIVTIRGKGTFVADVQGREIDPKIRDDIKVKLRRLMIEANYARLSKEEFIDWVSEEWETMEGKENESRKY